MKSLLAIVFLLLLSCGKGKDQPQGGVYYHPEELSKSEFQQLLSNRKLIGALSNSRADGVGVLVSITDNNQESQEVHFSSCTASLLPNGEVITAAHCLPRAMRKRKISCANSAFVNTRNRKVYRCAQVLWTGSDLVGTAFDGYANAGKVPGKRNSIIYPDILIFKLKVAPENLRPLTLSTHFAVESESLKAWVFSPIADPNNPQKKKAFHYQFENKSPCNFADNAEETYPFRSFSCKIKEGNSGSPALNVQNEIQGIVGGYLKSNSNGYFVDVGCLEKVNGKYDWKSGCLKQGTLLPRI